MDLSVKAVFFFQTRIILDCKLSCKCDYSDIVGATSMKKKVREQSKIDWTEIWKSGQ